MAEVKVIQPGPGEALQPAMMMTAPTQVYPGVPFGLEYLATLDQVKVHQVLHLCEAATGFEIENQYRICNSQEQQFFFAQEESDCCARYFCGNMRAFTMNILTTQNQAVMHMVRPLRCKGFGCCCCLQEMEIQCPVGNTIAYVNEVHTFWMPRYEVLDANKQPMFKIEGECCYCACCTDVQFKVLNASDGAHVGDVTKHWGGCREIFGGVNDFSVTFPADMHVLHKAILLGSTFLVDFMYFERNKNQ